MNKTTLRTSTLFALLVGGTFAGHATANQVCLESIAETTPESAFTVHGDGTVTQNEAGLMWRQCSLGQTFSNDSCTGSPTAINWQDALNAADQSSFADHDDWRVPNLKELSGIIEFRCREPAINLEIFPNTPPSGSPDYWTSTPLSVFSSSIWRVLFRDGAISTGSSTTASGRAVRLVRDVDD
ncbi:hypothetical protein J2T57_000774 [Natronocella acetinitrilica]|uniref:Lcl C-terminal domain-containing protein n=1 Tax=Natronocella acetinitrilica TaxID=414046 RepID=A0AAE3G0T9_9GAMM|nr:DUF1566 domain-containing protein [Natronocella acetinitrilica]MCP1673675.1 hypothetical protein [Natronocella acetinitrilica]